MKAKKRANHNKGHRPEENRKEQQIDLESGSWESIRREYDEKYPVFGSQIHFAIDVIRRAFNDARGK